MSPNETLFLESTSKIVKNGKLLFFLLLSILIYFTLSYSPLFPLFFFTTDISNSSFVQFQIWDFPGQLDFFDPAFDSEV